MMLIINQEIIDPFIKKHPDISRPLRVWLARIFTGNWSNFAKLKQDMPTVSLVSGTTFIFNIKGNSYRLTADIQFALQTLAIIKIETHAQYDRANKRQRQ